MAATTEEKSLKFSDYLRSKMLRKKGKHHQRVRSAGGPEAAILDSPSCTSSESESSPANSPFILRRRGRSLRGKAAAADVGGTDISPEEQGCTTEVDGFFLFDKKRHNIFSSSSQYSLSNPKNVQHLSDLLEQPENRSELIPRPGEDGPLHMLVCRPRPPKEKVDLLLAMLSCGSDVDINCKGKEGMTPLHYAVQMNNLASVQVLLSFGADVDVANARQHTPLDIATLLWLAYEKNHQVSPKASKLNTLIENTALVPSVYNHAMPSPFSSPMLQRQQKMYTSREYGTVDKSLSSLEGREKRTGEGGGRCVRQVSLEDPRELTSAVTPFKVSDVNEEAVVQAWRGDDEDSELFKSISTILEMLYSVHAQSGGSLLFKFKSKLPLLPSLSESTEFQNSMEAAAAVSPFLESQDDKERSVKIKDYLEGRTVFSLYDELEFNIARAMEIESSLAATPDLAIALALQEKELFQFRKTAKVGIDFEVRGGSRLLFLDGGGVKGLVQLEVLRQLEETTGRKVTQLFDWIIGSSIGAIIALCLVYGNKTLKDIRQLVFRMKDKVFANPRGGFAYDSKALEKMILAEFGRDICMCDVKKPKVLIGAVNKTYAPPVLHFFNNCFNDNFSQAPVWKVARYTSAAPIFFTEFEGYVDGGVLANNPCEYGLTAIQRYHREHLVNLPIAMVVSVGTGIYPPEELGRIDAQEFLFFGKHWFSFSDNVKKRAKNLLALLTNALVETEMVANSCKVRCLEQGIPYYRFSPQLSQVISAGETDPEKLLEMMWQARLQTPTQGLAELVTLFQLVAEASRKEKYRQSRFR